MKDKVTMIVISFRDQLVFIAWTEKGEGGGKENLEQITWFLEKMKGERLSPTVAMD